MPSSSLLPPVPEPAGDAHWPELVFVDRSLAIGDISEALAARLCQPAALLRGQPLPEALPGWAQTLTPLLRQVIATATPALNLDLPHPVPGPDDGLLAFVASCYPVRTGSGYIAGVDIALHPREEPATASFPAVSEHEPLQEQVQQQARLFEAERHARTRAERLQAVTAALGSIMSPDAVYAAVLHHGLGAAGAAEEQRLAVRSSSLYMLAGDSLELAGWDGFEPVLIERYRRIPLTLPIPIVDALRMKQAVWLHSKADYVQQYPHLVEQIRQLATESAVSLPVMVGDEALGVLTFTFAQAHAFGADEQRFLLALGEQAAQAIDRNRLVGSLRNGEAAIRRRSAQLQRLAQAAPRINATRDFVAVMQLVTDEARALIGAHQAVSSMTVGQSWSQAITAISLSERYAAWRDYATAPDGTGIYALVCQTNQPMCLTQAELEAHPAWRGFGSEAAAHPPMRGWLGVPLISRDGRNLGLIQLSDKEEGEFSADDEAMLLQLAQLTATALEQQQLLYEEQQARAAAEAAVRHREQFLSIASHELRTPLTAVMAHAQLFQRRALREHSLGERDQRSLQQILTHAERLNQMIGVMLDVSRIDQGRLQLEWATLDLAALVRSVVAALQETTPRHQLVVAGDDAPLWVAGDALRLEQVLQNLLSNAIKYSPGGGPVTVTLAAEAATAQVTILDQGIGIPAKDVPHIFERFYRAGNVSADTITGVGIGLFVVQEIIALHGGTLTVTSEERVGSRFTIALPRLADA